MSIPLCSLQKMNEKPRHENEMHFCGLSKLKCQVVSLGRPSFDGHECPSYDSVQLKNAKSWRETGIIARFELIFDLHRNFRAKK